MCRAQVAPAATAQTGISDEAIPAGFIHGGVAAMSDTLQQQFAAQLDACA